MRADFAVKIDPAYARIMRELRAAKGAYVTVGVQGADANIGASEDLNLAAIATVNEFGTKDGRIPPRPFMRNAWDKNQEALRVVQRKALEQVVDGKRTAADGLALIGAWFQAAVQNEIASNTPPPNAPRTIEMKGSSRTLIDTGRLRQGITYAVHMSGRDDSGDNVTVTEEAA
jgi:phage gpG-like protein